MTGEKENNCKCPLCGSEFYLHTGELSITCPSCGETVSRPQAEKYYSSMHVMKTSLKEAHGENYHRVRMLVDAAYDLVAAKRFDEAEERVNDALEITESDYRVYMAMVAAKTKNYTDLSDQSHKEYLNKAIACADQDGKKEITSAYKNYYEKTKLSDEELGRLANEEKKSKKKRTEEHLKKLIPEFMAKEKKTKVFLVLFPAAFVAGLACIFAGFFFDLTWLSLLSLALVLGGYLCFRSWMIGKDLVRAFNSLLDAYDVVDGTEIGDALSLTIYEDMDALATKFEDGDPFVSMSGAFMKLCADLLGAKEEKIDGYLSANRFWRDFYPRGEEEEE